MFGSFHTPAHMSIRSDSRFPENRRINCPRNRGTVYFVGEAVDTREGLNILVVPGGTSAWVTVEEDEHTFCARLVRSQYHKDLRESVVMR